jgi:alpha-tubulin suppressor-like RCC1 family protein
MLYRSLWRSGLLISVILWGLASSTMNLAAPKQGDALPDPHLPKFFPKPGDDGLDVVCVSGEILSKPMIVTKERATPIKPSPVWIRQLGSPNTDVSYDIAIGPQGNVYVTGYTTGKLGDQRYGYRDAWVAKYTSTGTLLWKKQLGATRFSAGTSSFGIAVDNEGSAYITGYTQGELGGQQQIEKLDAWVAKYSSSGALEWTKQIGTSTRDGAYSIAVDEAENFYLTGYTNGRLGGNGGGGREDVWLQKYGRTGQLQWKQQIGAGGGDFSYDITVDSSGNVYITGKAYGRLGANRFGPNDAWLAKYNSSGKLQWIRQFGTKACDKSSSITTDSRGNVYLTGVTSGELGDQEYGGYDAWVAKYSPTGKRLWIRQFGTTLDDIAFSITTDSRGDLYLTGATLGKLGGQQYGDSDAWVAKYEPNGTLRWIRQLGTSESDISLGIATDSNDNLYLTGTTRGKLGGQQDGGYDAWVAKYKP